MESKSEKCKTEERQPDEVRAREFYGKWSSEPIDGPWTTDEIMQFAAAFAQSIQAEALRAAKESGHLGHKHNCDYEIHRRGAIPGEKIYGKCDCGFAEKWGDLL